MASWVESSPVCYDGIIYIGSSDFRKVFGLDPASGQAVFVSSIEGLSWPTPAINEQYLFTGSVGSLHYMEDMHGRFYAIDRATGNLVWRLMVDDDPNVFAYGFASSPVIHDNWVYVGGLDGKIYGMDISKQIF